MEKAIGPNSAQRRAAMRAEAHNVAWAAAGPQVHFWRIGGFFLQEYMREGSGLRVDSYKVRGLFCKTTKESSISPVHEPDPTAEKGRRRGHARRPSFGAWIVFRRLVSWLGY